MNYDPYGSVEFYCLVVLCQITKIPISLIYWQHQVKGWKRHMNEACANLHVFVIDYLVGYQLVGWFRLMSTILHLIQNSYSTRYCKCRHNSMTYWTYCISVPHSHVFVHVKLNMVYSLTKVDPAQIKSPKNIPESIWGSNLSSPADLFVPFTQR